MMEVFYCCCLGYLLTISVARLGLLILSLDLVVTGIVDVFCKDLDLICCLLFVVFIYNN